MSELEEGPTIDLADEISIIQNNRTRIDDLKASGRYIELEPLTPWEQQERDEGGSFFNPDIRDLYKVLEHETPIEYARRSAHGKFWKVMQIHTPANLKELYELSPGQLIARAVKEGIGIRKDQAQELADLLLGYAGGWYEPLLVEEAGELFRQSGDTESLEFCGKLIAANGDSDFVEYLFRDPAQLRPLLYKAAYAKINHIFPGTTMNACELVTSIRPLVERIDRAALLILHHTALTAFQRSNTAERREEPLDFTNLKPLEIAAIESCQEDEREQEESLKILERAALGDLHAMKTIAEAARVGISPSVEMTQQHRELEQAIQFDPQTEIWFTEIESECAVRWDQRSGKNRKDNL